ncbi:TPA: hypothetical protein ACGGM7_000292 [Escherichia coli]
MDTIVTTQLITVGATLCGIVLTGAFSLVNLHITKKADNEKIKKQLLFKLTEEQLLEKKEIIKPLLQFFNSLNLPINHSNNGDDELLDRTIIKNYFQIKDKISNFMIDYVLYLNDDIKGLIWSLTSSIVELETLEGQHYNAQISDFENEELFIFNCGDAPSKVWTDLINLRNRLYDEINIINQF